MTRALVTQLVEALNKCRDWPGAHDECSAAVKAAREYLATEPKEVRQVDTLDMAGMRAELIVRQRWVQEHGANPAMRALAKATVSMLEADAQPKQVTCQIYGHVVGACVECNTHIEAQQAKKVGDSRFESWYSELNQAGKGSKQIAREAYEAGLNETNSQQAKRVPMTGEQITEMATQEQFLLVCDGLEELTQIVRATEQRHGITPADKGTQNVRTPTDWSAA